MRNLTAAMQAHLQSGGTSLAVCWRVERVDGQIIRSTEHDRSIVVDVGSPDTFGLSGTYLATVGITGGSVRSTSDLSVDNLDVKGGFSTYTFDGIDGDDLEAGLLDKAAFTIFMVNFRAPEDGVIILRRGTIGNIKRDDDGNWRCELRSISQALSQVQGRSYGILCDADLGDDRCGVTLASFTFSGIVTAVTSKRVFEALVDVGSPSLDTGYFKYGLLTFTSGLNTGFAREIASDSLTDFSFFESFPREIAEDDTFTVSAGCNKELNIEVISGESAPSVANGRVTGDCAVKFDNAPNFRGFPNKPGPDTLVRLRTPSAKSGSGGGKK